ncbi:hypothetical protein BBJ28_00013232 [Nothophytophthora sp. Chile5]|nr:hypothetical protein BBJ28_00013232 [Nothophytophthora sp. Chile5]
MLPHRVPVAASRRLCAPLRRRKVVFYVLCLMGVALVLQTARFLYGKCDTRAYMSTLLTKTTRILKRHGVEYWLDKGTLLGVHRDDGLIPWEYDVDLGVMNATCAEISALKSEFTAVGLTAYDREDDIPHKVKLTYDTENHEFYWSDPRLHDPCIRVYDTNDVGAWVDIYWYVELTPEQAAADRENVLVPPDYDEEDNLMCCSEGLQAHTEHMCCGGCVPKKTLFPLKRQIVAVHDGVELVQEQPVPFAVPQFLSIQYGESALTSREIKVSEGPVVSQCWRRVAMDEEFSSTPPRRGNPKRLQRKAESSPVDLLQQQRLKREMHLTRELIDFDMIKGSAFFHTKPSGHDRKLVQEGLGRALFVPFHAKFWRQKPWFYETATSLYTLHVVAVYIYIFRPKTTSVLNSFEVLFPITLLLLVAIGYGRVSSTLQAPDSDPSLKILSPIKESSGNACNAESDNSQIASGLSSGLAESENSDGTDSDEDSGNSSSSSDEANPNDNMFGPTSASAPSSPKHVRLCIRLRTRIGLVEWRVCCFWRDN